MSYQQRRKTVGSIGAEGAKKSMQHSFELDVAAGVRQWCVLSPRLFCSVPECALSTWRAPCNGVSYNFETEEFLFWNCALLMISFPLRNCMKKSVRYFACWWMPPDKLVLIRTPGKQKKKITTRNDDFGTGPCAQVGSHDLSLQHRLVAASKAVFTTNRLCLSTVWPLHID